MRNVLPTLGAAVAGSLMTVFLLAPSTPQSHTAHAQVPQGSPPQGGSPQGGPRFPGAGGAVGRPPQPPASAHPALFDAQGLTPDERVNIAVYELANRSVVNISTLSVRPERWLLMALPSEGNGSGAVLDQTGHVLTNYHVIEGAREVHVTLFNEETYPAKLVGADPVNDIAIIKIEAPAEQLFPTALGDSDALKVGMRVFALGNPFGLDRTMSVGIISSLDRSLEVRQNWVIKSIIQIDAAINPGNSGGPLLDAHGRLIGMNTAIATDAHADIRQSAGIGFAIPISLIARVVPELIQHGRVIRGEIGITHISLTEKGLRIRRLTPGGPAERAGLRGPQIVRQRRGPFVIERTDINGADVITAIDGQKVTSASEFLGVIESKKPGNTIQLTVLREGKEVIVPVTLGGESPPAPIGNGPPPEIPL